MITLTTIIIPWIKCPDGLGGGDNEEEGGRQKEMKGPVARKMGTGQRGEGGRESRQKGGRREVGSAWSWGFPGAGSTWGWGGGDRQGTPVSPGGPEGQWDSEVSGGETGRGVVRGWPSGSCLEAAELHVPWLWATAPWLWQVLHGGTARTVLADT